ncbi:hypothetical protein AU467_04235 [Mesorhizobium loti]|uniref:Uncharacterized protein n=1 Tax=Rhizobium loti TaxID=381 RepID=A0A101KQJ7_RHILI|nr:hypothetical protein AU467_04235 [Mesorhizobium loti]
MPLGLHARGRLVTDLVARIVLRALASACMFLRVSEAAWKVLRHMGEEMKRAASFFSSMGARVSHSRSGKSSKL